MKVDLKVKGMHCHSCETIVMDALSEISGITNVKADAKKGTVSFEAKDQSVVAKAREAIQKEGYKTE